MPESVAQSLRFNVSVSPPRQNGRWQANDAQDIQSPQREAHALSVAYSAF
jgi:hypothetical protein